MERREGQPGHCSGSDSEERILSIFIMREGWWCKRLVLKGSSLYKTGSVSVASNVSHTISGEHKLPLQKRH